MGSFGPFEIVAILLVILLLFGAKRIPEIARGLGKGIREFKDATNEIKQEITADPPRQIPQAPPPQTQAQASPPVATRAAPPAPPVPPPADGQAPESQT